MEYGDHPDIPRNTWRQQPAGVNSDETNGGFHRPVPLWEKLEELRADSRARMHWNDDKMVLPEPVQNLGSNQNPMESEDATFRPFKSRDNDQLPQKEEISLETSTLKSIQSNDFVLQQELNQNSPSPKSHQASENLPSESESNNDSPISNIDPVQHNFPSWLNIPKDDPRGPSDDPLPNDDSVSKNNIKLPSSSLSPIEKEDFLQQNQPVDREQSEGPLMNNGPMSQNQPPNSPSSNDAIPKNILFALQNKPNDAPHPGIAPSQNFLFSLHKNLSPKSNDAPLHNNEDAIASPPRDAPSQWSKFASQNQPDGSPHSDNNFALQNQPSMNSPSSSDPQLQGHNFALPNQPNNAPSSSEAPLQNNNFALQKQPNNAPSSSEAPLQNNFALQKQPNNAPSSSEAPQQNNNFALLNQPNNAPSSSEAPLQNNNFALLNQPNNAPSSSEAPQQNNNFALLNQPNNALSSSEAPLQNNNFALLNQPNDALSSSKAPLQNNNFALQNQPNNDAPRSNIAPLLKTFFPPFFKQDIKPKSQSSFHESFGNAIPDINIGNKENQKEDSNSASENEVNDISAQETNFHNNNNDFDRAFGADEEIGLKNEDDESRPVFRKLLSVRETREVSKHIDLNKIKKEVEAEETKELPSKGKPKDTNKSISSTNSTTPGKLNGTDSGEKTAGMEDMMATNSSGKEHEPNATQSHTNGTAKLEDMLHSNNKSAQASSGSEDMVATSEENNGPNATPSYEEGLDILNEMLSALNQSIESIIHDDTLNESIANEEHKMVNVSSTHLNAQNNSLETEVQPMNVSIIHLSALNSSLKNESKLGNISVVFVSKLNDSNINRNVSVLNGSLGIEQVLVGNTTHSNDVGEENSLEKEAGQSAAYIAELLGQLLGDIEEVEDGGSAEDLDGFLGDGDSGEGSGTGSEGSGTGSEGSGTASEGSGTASEGSGTASASGDGEEEDIESGKFDGKDLNVSGSGGGDVDSGSGPIEASGSGDEEESVDMVREAGEAGLGETGHIESGVTANTPGQGEEVTQKGSWEGVGSGSVDMSGSIVNSSNATAINDSESTDDESGFRGEGMEEGSADQDSAEGSSSGESGESSRGGSGESVESNESGEESGEERGLDKEDGEDLGNSQKANRKPKALSMHEIMKRIRKRIAH